MKFSITVPLVKAASRAEISYFSCGKNWIRGERYSFLQKKKRKEKLYISTIPWKSFLVVDTR